MAAKVGLTIVKAFTYRGDSTEEFSNTYHLTGTVPDTPTAWRTLFDALVAQEKTVYASAVSVVRGYAYATDNPSDDSVWSVDLVTDSGVVPGTLSLGTGTPAPGDCAVWVRWKTSRLTSPGSKPIYLRKYFHGALMASGGVGDTILASQKTALLALGAKLQDGSFTEARTITAQAHDDTIVSHAASSYITTRTLKRRGKRPGS
jgi:hypothetical protein